MLGYVGNIEIKLTRHEAAKGSHQGSCDHDLADLRKYPKIRQQLNRLDPEVVKKELAEFGAWSDKELEDHDLNLTRVLWIACGYIVDDLSSRGHYE